MSQCEGCSADDIYGPRKQRQQKHHLVWLCPPCRRRLLNLPVPAPQRRDLLDWLPLAKIGFATLAVVASILAIGAHW